MGRRGIALVIAVAATVGGAASVRAATPADGKRRTARFTFERGAGAELCPEPEAVQRAVAQRLGFDPFDSFAADGGKDIRCTLSGDAGGVRARIEISDDPAQPATERILSSPRRDCVDLAEAIEVALSIAINPLLALEPVTPPPAPAAARPVAPTPGAAHAGTPASAPPQPTGNRGLRPAGVVASTAPAPVAAPFGALALGIQTLATAGVGPAPAFGVGLIAGVRRRWLSVELTARAVAPSSATASGGQESNPYPAPLAKAYVYFGGASFGSAGPGVSFTGENMADWFGAAMIGAGDVDDDGFDDVAILSRGLDQTGGPWPVPADNGEHLYIFRGGATPDARADVSRKVGPVGSGGLAMRDLDGDSRPDLLVGRWMTDYQGVGAVEVFLGANGYGPSAATLVGMARGDAFGAKIRALMP